MSSCSKGSRTQGLVIALLGVLAITPDAVVVRYLSDDGGVDAWAIIFWKMCLSLPLTASYAVYDMGGWTAVYHTVRTHGRLYAAAMIPQAAINIGFTFAFVYTTAAHALLLVNLNPLWCAVLARFLLNEQLPRHTIVALVLALGCILLTFLPEIIMGTDQDDSSSDHHEDDDDENDSRQESTTTKGNIIALLTGLAIALYIMFIRKGGKDGVNMMAVSPIATVFVSALALGLQQGAVGPSDVAWPSDEVWKFWMAVAAEGTMMGVVFVALAIAPRLITATEMALVLLLEVILGPLWVFLAYRETPSLWTLLGGLLLVAVLALHEVYPLVFPLDPSTSTDKDDIDKNDEKDGLEDEVDNETKKNAARGDEQAPMAPDPTLLLQSDEPLSSDVDV